MKLTNYLRLYFILFLITAFPLSAVMGLAAPLSEDSETCIDCHSSLHPGIVGDWRKSRHGIITPAEGIKRSDLEKRVSTNPIPQELMGNIVGCAECHTLNQDNHKDSFDHNGYQVHTVVTPEDCAICHLKERDQYKENMMSHAYGNLQKNVVYRSLVDSINGTLTFEGMELSHKKPNSETDADSCFYCHGTVVKVDGMETRDTDEGEMEFPKLTGWPNQGVGRVNPDGSMGSCSSCHTRHQFSIKTARSPYTCAECHKGPDVPAYQVYSVSKHGNIFSSENKSWDFENVPWIVGRDFTSPTCASCHVSLIVSEDGMVISERSHRMMDRLEWRIFGLVYAHPQPRSPDTTIIKNMAGLPLPTELTGEPVKEFLIDLEEQAVRKENMQKVCLACHSSSWTEGHFKRLENSIMVTNKMTLSATNIILTSWDKGFAKGLAQKDSIFNETIEKMWVEHWLFYANSIRFASAMAGADYGTFANGRWYMTKNLQMMVDWLESKSKKEDRYEGRVSWGKR